MKTIRGAITIKNNSETEIRTNTIILLEEILSVNNITASEVESIIFTATKDITRAYPAKFAREIGFENATLMCMQEMNVEGSLPLCIRVLMFINQSELTNPTHVYLKGAEKLRPDLKKL
ncbi:MAG: chorismate mutase [Dethiosulfatibacter sp.]|nr:chorismate mutase [Dethiosulfatibacter sp.]